MLEAAPRLFRNDSLIALAISLKIALQTDLQIHGRRILIHRIDHDGLDVATALHDTREAAHRALLGLDARTPGSHAQDLWLILRRATGYFHHNTSPDILQTRYGITVPAGSAG